MTSFPSLHLIRWPAEILAREEAALETALLVLDLGRVEEASVLGDEEEYQSVDESENLFAGSRRR
jgi:hypothetical protein